MRYDSIAGGKPPVVRSLPVVLLLVVYAGLSSCSSETEFAGGQAKAPPVTPEEPAPRNDDALPDGPQDQGPGGDETSAPTDNPKDEIDTSTDFAMRQFNRIRWDFPCTNDGDSGAMMAGTEAWINGHGTYLFDPFELASAELIVSGEVCPAEKIRRDIVFVIDVSGSMSGNDPLVQGSCGRLNAVQEVIKRSPVDGTASFGVVTFDNIVRKSSPALAVTQDELFTGVSGDPAAIAADICNIGGGTNYTDALNAASALLLSGRGDATKEIYFISDGAPSAGFDGVAIANSLKTEGLKIGYANIKATIVTIMLKGTDTVLESQIASRDATGKALHAQVDKSDVLAQTLAELFTNRIVEATVRYRARGTTDWISEDVLGMLLGKRFMLEPILLADLETTQAEGGGLELQVSYVDNLSQTYLHEAGIKWCKKEAPPPGADYQFEKDAMPEM